MIAMTDLSEASSVTNDLHRSSAQAEATPAPAREEMSIDSKDDVENNPPASAVSIGTSNENSNNSNASCSCCRWYRYGRHLICGTDPAEDTPEYRQRKRYLYKLAAFELIESGAPVFIAAGLSYSATNIILLVSRERIDVEITLLLGYALIVFVMGKFLCFHMLRDEALISRNPLFNLIRRYNLSAFIRHCLVEISGFALKEFFVSFIFRLDYTNYGSVGAVNGFAQMIVGMITFIIFAGFLQRSYFQLKSFAESLSSAAATAGDNEERPEEIVGATTTARGREAFALPALHQELLNYSAEAFAFAIAFNFTVLIAIGSMKTGWGFFSTSSYLFVWRDDYDNDRNGQQFLPYYFLYALLVHFLTGMVMYFEKQLFTRSAIAEWTPLESSTKTIIVEDQNRLNSPGQSMQHVGDEESKAEEESVIVVDSAIPSKPPTQECEAAAAVETLGVVGWGCWDFCKKLVGADVQTTLLLLWDTTLGYFAAVSLFIIIADFLSLNKIIHSVDLLNYFITLIVVCVISIKFPSYIAQAHLKQERLQQRIIERKIAHQRTIEEIISSKQRKSESSATSNILPVFFGRDTIHTSKSIESGKSVGSRECVRVSTTVNNPLSAPERCDSGLQSEISLKHKQDEESGCSGSIGHLNESSIATEDMISDSIADADTERYCCNIVCILRTVYKFVDFYREMRWERRGVRMVSVRLSSGWVWEAIVQVSIGMIFASSINSNSNEAARLAEMCVTAVCIIALAVIIHLYVRDWKKEVKQLEEQQRQQVEHPSDNIEAQEVE